MLGIENLLLLTGDHTKMGDHPQAKPVFDLDSVSLIHAVKQLESGVDLGGNQLVGEPPKFAKGAVVSPCSDSVDAQLAKMERKVAAGADYFQTQAVFEPEKFIKFMEKAKQFGKPVQIGIIIPKSVGMARFMNLLPKIKIEIVVSLVPVQTVLKAAKEVLHTGQYGDGKVFIYDIENVVKIRTGEEGYLALQDTQPIE